MNNKQNSDTNSRGWCGNNGTFYAPVFILYLAYLFEYSSSCVNTAVTPLLPLYSKRLNEQTVGERQLQLRLPVYLME